MNDMDDILRVIWYNGFGSGEARQLALLNTGQNGLGIAQRALESTC
jgi:hypothetical protein